MSLCSSVMLYSKTSLQTIAAWWSASTDCECDEVTCIAVLFILADQSMTGLYETNGHIHTQFCMIPGVLDNCSEFDTHLSKSDRWKKIDNSLTYIRQGKKD